MLFPNFEKNTKKNKIVKFPTKMKEIIGAPQGRLSYGALKGALIIPNMVYILRYVGKIMHVEIHPKTCTCRVGIKKLLVRTVVISLVRVCFCSKFLKML